MFRTTGVRNTKRAASCLRAHGSHSSSQLVRNGALVAPCVRSVETAAAVSNAVARPHPLFDYRRLKNRRGWKVVPDDDELDLIRLPRERLGRHYELNWTICKYAVIPNKDGEAFHNLHLRGLQMYCNATVDQNKAMHVNIPAADYNFQHHFVLPDAPKPVEGSKEAVDISFAPVNAKVVGESQFKLISREVRRFLSEGLNMFVHDGAVGSHVMAEEKVRFICSNANTALFLKHVIPRIPQQLPGNFEENITVFVAPELKVSPEKTGLSNGTVINLKENKIFIAGTQAPEALQQAVSSLASFLAAQKGALPLECESTLASDGRPVFLFSSGSLLQGKPRNDLFGSFGHFWTNNGVCRMYDGATYKNVSQDAKLNRGDLLHHVEEGGKRSSRLSVPINTTSNKASHPAAIVFLTNATNQSGLTKVSVDDAVKLYGSSFSFPVPVKPELLEQRFRSLLAQHKVDVYQLAVKEGQQQPDIKEINKALKTSLQL